MREIKFRGKRPFVGGWLYGLLDIQGNDVEIFSRENNTFSKGIVIPRTIGQFTGLYDKNGKEVFEGDVVKLPAGNMRVSFSDGAFVLIPPKTNVIYEALGLIEDEYEIIGNIHENPELLERWK